MPNPIIPAVILFLVAALSLLLTGLIRDLALRGNLLDLPNKRSSHTRPTPRGGGPAVVLAFFSGLLLCRYFGLIATDMLIALIGAGSMAAGVGFLDDRCHVPPARRLAAHFLAAAWGLYWLGSLPPLALFSHNLDLGSAAYPLAALYLVWLLNLYNFMDGINGIAGIETITVCLGGALVHLVIGTAGDEWLAAVLLAGAAAGFLYWNFPVALIFMGDSGSGFLGLSLGLLSIRAGQTDPELFWCWLILLGVFVVDATTTLIRRALRHEPLHEAHRSHAYQYAARRFASHAKVTSTVGLINLCWLIPMALLVANGSLPGPAGLLLAYPPLIILAFRFKAGTKEEQEEG